MAERNNKVPQAGITLVSSYPHIGEFPAMPLLAT
jgi:hypothetical protein